MSEQLFYIKSDRDNRIVGGPFTKEVADGELDRLTDEAAAHAPTAINMPTEAEAELDANARAIRDMHLANGPAPAESFSLEEVPDSAMPQEATE